MSEERTVARNRSAHFEFEILDKFEAGLVLTGTEVKSLREGTAQIADGYARLVDGELYLCNVDIPAYRAGNRSNHEPRRRRKCLVHARELRRLAGKLRERGLTLVPLSLYFKRGFAKIYLGLARGKKRHDKRQTIRKREAKREMSRAMSGRRRS